ncbi:hypothetical protein MPSEU_000006500 [Mayamaea pseudoterrestris]|nr:hypothetical protein MPSEU_000006500 [Mayamaea pseudoterrestris]
MSTPIKNDFKQAARHVRTPTEELKQQMLFMVNLQNEQQRQQSSIGRSSSNAAIANDTNETNASYNNLLSHSPTPYPTLKASNSSGLLKQAPPPRIPPPPQATAALNVTDKDFFLDPTVGTGTMTINFAATKTQQQQDSLEASPITVRPPVVTAAAAAAAAASQRSAPTSLAAADATTTTTTTSSLLQLPSSNHATTMNQSTLKSRRSLTGNLNSYGTLGLNAEDDQDEAMLPSASEQQQHESSLTQQRDQVVQSDAYYGVAATAASDPYAPLLAPSGAAATLAAPNMPSYQQQQHHGHQQNVNKPAPLRSMPIHPRRRSLLHKLSSCCNLNQCRGRFRRNNCSTNNISTSCCSSNNSNELLRSFCYGAIDGLLTGSSILGAFYGLQLLPAFGADVTTTFTSSSDSTTSTTLLLCCLSASACLADALCMGVGHVWSTRNMVEHQVRERSVARRSLLQHRADAKGQLVDVLLQKGMLKIDAMSIADTLEGYPDLFVSALLGEAFTVNAFGAAGGDDHDDDDQCDFRPPQEVFYSELEYSSDDAAAAAAPTSVLHVPSHPRLSEATYDASNSVSHAVDSAVNDARKEALCMMLGFGIFSLVPSLVVHGVALMLGEGSGANDDGDVHGGFSVAAHPTVLAMTVIGSVMWVLGVWKSRFVDSHWLLYAVETLVVWSLCMACAYFCGSFLKSAFLA